MAHKNSGGGAALELFNFTTQGHPQGPSVLPCLCSVILRGSSESSTGNSHGHKAAATVQASLIFLDMAMFSRREEFLHHFKEQEKISQRSQSGFCFIVPSVSLASACPTWVTGEGHGISMTDLVKHRAMWRRVAYLDHMGSISQTDAFCHTSLVCIF